MLMEIIKMAFESLLSNKTRTSLSMLGIVIGVSTVIAVFAIGQGAQKAVDEQFQGLSANSIIVMSMRGRGMTGSSNLKAADADLIKEKAKYISEVTVVSQGNATASFGSTSESLSVMGVQENYFSMSSIELASGRLISAEDVADQEKVVVLGSGAVETFFPDTKEIVG
ncbi:MAG: ABC transporter permease, partial [Candidatus Magasanikbacteria bacterium]|nr:ABC transporter permease [Candidatus Magasanikbacteria bacterium]